MSLSTVIRYCYLFSGSIIASETPARPTRKGTEARRNCILPSLEFGPVIQFHVAITAGHFGDALLHGPVWVAD